MIEVQKINNAERRGVASCNFCNDFKNSMNILTSSTGGIEIRVCDGCGKELKKKL